MTIVLTGFMASGKTTIGKILSPLVDMPFVDCDCVFETEMGLPPSTYIVRFGEEAFRKHESRLLRDILTRHPAMVLATGGGAILKSSNRSLLLQSGFVVYLEVGLPILLLRLQESFDRPLIAIPPAYSQTKSLLEVRLPFYQQCHFKISNAYLPPKDVAIAIAQNYKEYQHASGAA